jgi:serine/threonine protein kinase
VDRALHRENITPARIHPLTGIDPGAMLVVRLAPRAKTSMLPMTYRATELDERAPQELHRYRLLRHLAKGGMAEVFLARTEGIGGFQRLLVIKRILPELASDTEFVRMFLDEARIAATLHHANIVQVFEVGVADGQVFMAMEHLHGQDVASAVGRLAERGARIPLGNAIAITTAVAAGLHYAHERCASDGQPLGIVHRDIAPSNVLVTYDGNVKLIDFGIAKAANNLSRTKFGLFKGKLPYASPEQCRCEPVDRRTDVFSLGVMLYELTTGERLFTADNEYELLRVVSEAVVPRPRLRDKAYPRALEAIVLRALAAKPEDRFPSAQALQHELEMFAAAQQLDLSSMSLARLMESAFDPELMSWQSAERAGRTLEEHITTSGGRAIDAMVLEVARGAVGADAADTADDAHDTADDAHDTADDAHDADGADTLGGSDGATDPVAADSITLSEPIAMADLATGAVPIVPSTEARAASQSAAATLDFDVAASHFDVAASHFDATSHADAVAAPPASRALRVALVAVAAASLISVGAAGALWWASRDVTVAAPASAAPTGSNPPAGVTAPAGAPVQPAPLPAGAAAPSSTTEPPAVAAQSASPTTAPTEAAAAPDLIEIDTPSPPATVEPARAPAAEPSPPPARPVRKSKRTHPRNGRAAAPESGAPAAPERAAKPKLDDAALDEVAPRPTRSP